MTPIISPWFFYFYHFIDRTGVLLMLFGLILMFAGFILYMVCTFNEKELEDLGIVTNQKQSKWISIIGSIMLSISLLMPNQETLIQMLIAKNITYENAAAGAEYVEDLCSNIINITIKEDD